MTPYDNIDYSDYTLNELHEARSGVDKDKFPNNAAQIDYYIKIKEGFIAEDSKPPERTFKKKHHQKSSTHSFTDQVKWELEKISNPKSNLAKNIGILLLTLFLFVSFGFFDKSITNILIILLVLFIHEAGHFIGMKLFGYRDVQMFFIPMLGAAVSGVESNPSSVRKAVVSLLGPLPGIIIGIIAAVLFFKTKQDIFAVSASTFLFINGFNMLPFHPLDGGRFFDYLLFSRNPKTELIFKILTCLALGGLAFFIKAPLLGFFALFVLFSLRVTFLSAQIAQRLKSNPELTDLKDNNIPEAQLNNVINELKQKLIAHSDNAKVIARHTHAIWQRVCNKSASIAATTGMILLYFPFMTIGLAAPFVFEAGKAIAETKTEIVQSMKDDGSYASLEVRHLRGIKISEIPINDTGLYHGVATNWSFATGEKTKIGSWKEGYWHGKWDFFETGKLVSFTEYDMGKPINYAVMKNGTIHSLPESEWPSHIRNTIQSEPEGTKESLLTVK